MLKASAEDASKADRPSAAASTWIIVALWMPRSDTKPAMRPCAIERATMYSTAGPGISNSTRAAPTKRPMFEALGMTISITESPGTIAWSASFGRMGSVNRQRALVGRLDLVFAELHETMTLVEPVGRTAAQHLQLHRQAE